MADEAERPTCCKSCQWEWLDRTGSLSAAFIACPECGNKRCPKATRHQLACTGSNASGQPGSWY